MPAQARYGRLASAWMRERRPDRRERSPRTTGRSPGAASARTRFRQRMQYDEWVDVEIDGESQARPGTGFKRLRELARPRRPGGSGRSRGRSRHRRAGEVPARPRPGVVATMSRMRGQAPATRDKRERRALQERRLPFVRSGRLVGVSADDRLQAKAASAPATPLRRRDHAKAVVSTRATRPAEQRRGHPEQPDARCGGTPARPACLRYRRRAARTRARLIVPGSGVPVGWRRRSNPTERSL